MKKHLSLFVCIHLVLTIFGQTKDANNYLIIKGNVSKHFKTSTNEYWDYFSNNVKTLDEKLYYPRVRKYSWGKIDSAFYREDSIGYYHFDPKVKKESLVFPKIVTLGQKWLEADSSWSYEIISVNKELTTPTNKYKDLVVIECVQLTNRDKQKSKIYHIYYAKNLGMVASGNYVGLKSYLADIKFDN